ncbi:NEW3 domain-containing protein [Pseudogulbenkiania ferrooxidans]|uniref:Peptidase M11 gametolysin n=1 Tax=Pseudogulbenkiania ferrooxidans 2002 TaxID=279714 RepID=B9Z6B2_9NEIS|nr:NEW3 domain-containing protein [Pseudogulbenkiania ferrooxidans]EEG07756.1 Peptidase M11 gametolysin [Pseudogulbenkiania ferrooxidans 2002]
MLRHSGGLSGQRVGLHYILMCCWLTLLFFASPSFAQSTAGLKNSPQASSSAQSVQLQGTLEVLHSDDLKNKKSHNRYFLKTDAGVRYEIQFKKGHPRNAPGSKVRVTGTQSGNTIMLESTGTTSYQVLAAPASGLNALGEQKTAVLLVNFQDQPTNKPWTLADWNSFVFGTASGTVNNFYLENSYQQTWFAGNVFGWYTLPINSTDACNTDNIAAAARTAASAAGVDLSGYAHLVYVFPNTSSCSWGGLSSVGTVPSQSFINGFMKLDVVGHELGHALGLWHSHGLDCDVSPTGNSCSYIEYGDHVDLMGWQTGHFNAFQKERLGWLNYNVSPPIATVQSSGSYVIEPMESAGGGNPKGLKILKSTDPTTGAKTWYYLEYRQPIGVDYYFSTNSIYQPANIFGGVLVRTGTDGDASSSFSLDMTPGSLSSSTGADLADPALVVGQSYTDASAGVTITPTWANSTGIGIDVTFAKTACTRANPSVAISPAQSSSVLAGTAVTYTVAVTNNDSSGCSASTFSLQGTVPSGWSGTWAAASLNIGPGSVSSTTYTVTSSSSAAAGTYSISGKATNTAATAYSGSGSASYVIGTSSTSTTTTKGKGRTK